MSNYAYTVHLSEPCGRKPAFQATREDTIRAMYFYRHSAFPRFAYATCPQAEPGILIRNDADVFAYCNTLPNDQYDRLYQELEREFFTTCRIYPGTRVVYRGPAGRYQSDVCRAIAFSDIIGRLGFHYQIIMTEVSWVEYSSIIKAAV